MGMTAAVAQLLDASHSAYNSPLLVYLLFSITQRAWWYRVSVRQVAAGSNPARGMLLTQQRSPCHCRSLGIGWRL